ncbi:MAG: hypothetical protein MR822_01085 [Bacteroidales bacterium]|jgi:hypothetical protein|nr:hypothetical protein [Bacteroidales bacterium]MDD6960755.1 hypothetical protein [Bacteroidales bacterium]MDY6185626.1 hypothetical protein [Muribaculaceae bacterium]
MIFNFRLVSDEVDNFKREIEIDADDTFLDLRNAICDAVQYDRSEMCSFFLCDDSWEKEKEITLEDMGTDSDEDTYLMDECILSDYLDDEGQKLMFVFDYMTDRAFFLQLKKIITGKSLKDPVCTLSMGKAPDQHIDMKRFEAEIDAKAAKQASLEDFGEDFDEDGYNEDEFDPEGFSDLTFDEH